jgi:hypothetical protein
MKNGAPKIPSKNLIPSIVQIFSTSNTLGGSKTVSFPSPPTQGNTILALIGTQSAWSSTVTIAQDFVLINEMLSSGASCGAYYKICELQDVNSYTFGVGSAGRINIYLIELSGQVQFETFVHIQQSGNSLVDFEYNIKGFPIYIMGKNGNGSYTYQNNFIEAMTLIRADVLQAWYHNQNNSQRRKLLKITGSRSNPTGIENHMIIDVVKI